jgi:tetratricopeptide (TPR) repeat protein
LAISIFAFPFSVFCVWEGVMKTLAPLLLILSVVPAAAQTAEPEYVSATGAKYYAQADANGAVAEAEKNLAADAKNVELILALGRAQGGIWRFRAAVATYTRGLELAPNDARLLVARGHRYISLRQPDKALADLKKAATIDPQAAGLWYHLGLAHYLRGEFNEAAAAFEKSRAEAKTDAELMGPSDWLYMSLRRAGKAADAAKVLERITPEMKIEGNENLYFSRLLLYKGVKKEAELPLPAPSDDLASELRVSTLAYGIGNWHFYNSRTAKAREYFERAVQSKAWAAFGFICAENDLARMPGK